MFVFGFAKNERENVDDDELDKLRKAARILLGLRADQIRAALEAGELKEICDGKQATA